MLKAERHKYIMDKLVEEQKVNTINLAKDLNISEDSVRRDLNELNRKDFLTAQFLQVQYYCSIPSL